MIEKKYKTQEKFVEKNLSFEINLVNLSQIS